MAEKEGGDSEKKMTKDFLDRWKKISKKYEGPEEEKAAKEKPTEPRAPRPAEQDLDAFLVDMGGKGEGAPAKGAAKKDEGKDLDQLLEEFGLSKEGTGLPKKSAEAPRPAPAPPQPTPEEQQRRVLETLKKVGLIGPGAPEREAPEPSPSEHAPAEEEQEQA